MESSKRTSGGLFGQVNVKKLVFSDKLTAETN
jgi:hypothetical protein